VKIKSRFGCSDHKIADPEGREENEKQAHNPWTSEEQSVASFNISLEESRRTRPWRAGGGKKAS